MVKKASESAISVEIPRPNLQTAVIGLIGETRLVLHRWSEKARKEMLDKQMKRASSKKEAKDPEADFRSSLYTSEDGWYGFPASGFKKSAVSACRYIDGLPMTQARGVLRVLHDGADSDGIELVKIWGDGPHMREDMVRLGDAKGTADIRYRGEFREWFAVIRVRYNANVISEEQLLNLFALAGLHVGIGEGRPGAPKNTMDWGTFRLADAKEMKKLIKEAA
ncbi:MAG TPA: hypothetical protein VK979_04320 [Guyparkeria sp.]|nr:hypothetical protein [Guyparkeria sp.]